MRDRGILNAVVYFGWLILKVANVRLETVGRSHLDREKMMVVLLELLDCARNNSVRPSKLWIVRGGRE